MWREFWNLDGMSFGCWIEPEDRINHNEQHPGISSEKEHKDTKSIAKKKRKKLTFKLK